MLARGNSKLGRTIHSFSLPARTTCPGSTALCESVCYAEDGNFRRDGVQRLYRLNYRASRRQNFVARCSRELEQLRPAVVRIHVSGDFYDAPYVRKWIRICRRHQDTMFFGYTRSWRVKRLLPALRELSQQPNVQLWWSVDADTHRWNGRPPRWKGVRVAYMRVATDEPVPAYADLVFRDDDRAPLKFVDGRLICPAENGVQTSVKMTCERCGICYNQGSVALSPQLRELLLEKAVRQEA